MSTKHRKPRVFLWGDVVFGILGAGAVLFLSIVYFTSRKPDPAEVSTEPPSASLSYFHSALDTIPDPVIVASADLDSDIASPSESEAASEGAAREQEREKDRDKTEREALTKEPSSASTSFFSGDPDWRSLPGDYDPDDIPMRVTDSSTIFSSIGYDAEYKVLKVTFRDSGRSYLYLDFSRSDWSSFTSADSLGAYYNQNIKGIFDSISLDD